MKNLPDVTLVIVDTVAHDLAWEAVNSTLKQIQPKEVLVFSDKVLSPDWKTIRLDVNSMEDYCNALWYWVPQEVKTSHYLIVQWDSWVLDGSLWQDHWLDYDYIGAPWWYIDFYNVGNGGFSLRSAELAKFLIRKQVYFPLTSPKEDDLLCRNYQSRLIQAGFMWGPNSEAQRFSFERVPVSYRTFGFHGVFNWNKVLTPSELDRRMLLASDYVRSRSEWQELQTDINKVAA